MGWWGVGDATDSTSRRSTKVGGAVGMLRAGLGGSGQVQCICNQLIHQDAPSRPPLTPKITIIVHPHTEPRPPVKNVKRGFPTVLGAWITENRFRARSSCSGLKTLFAFSQKCTSQFIIFHMTKIACAALLAGRGRAAPASPLAEGRGFCRPLSHVCSLASRPPSRFPCHGDCLRRDSPTPFSTTLGSFITRAMVARNIKL